MAKESYHCEQASPANPPQEHFFRQLLLLRADGLDKVLHNFLIILLKSAKVLVLLELYARWESTITIGGYSRHFLT
jgi:predicted membrane chloride channel (bestrophin family)